MYQEDICKEDIHRWGLLADGNRIGFFWQWTGGAVYESATGYAKMAQDGCKEVYSRLFAMKPWLALFTILEEDENIATISENTTFLQGVKIGEITASGRVIKKGRHVAFAEGNVKKSEAHFYLRPEHHLQY